MTENLLDQLDETQRRLLRACGRMAVERGARAYLVGGSVRDLILGRPHDDVDVVVEGDGLGVAQDLSRALGGELTRHHAFQTATVATPDGVRVDVATARSESYPRAGQLPQVVPGTLEEDLLRRDFTINTVAVALSEAEWGRQIDPLGGRADLEQRLLRVMHARSFADDPTRILRALRFVLRFGYTLEESTYEQLRAAVAGGYLDEVSGDRVRKEIRLMFTEQPVEGPLRLQLEGVLSGLQAGLHATEAPLRRLRELIAWYDEMVEDGEARGFAPWSLVLACCADPLAQQARWRLARRLKLSREERRPLIEAGTPWQQAVAALDGIGTPPASEIERSLRDVPPDALLVRAAVDGGDVEQRVRRYLGRLRRVSPSLTGADLRDLGVAEGPQVGEILDRLRAARLDGEAASAAEERRLVASWLAEEAR